MTAEPHRYSYGPVPSRRLGRSLGINNIPAKVCTYSCVYCQVGRTTEIPQERRSFFDPDEIVADVRLRLAEAKQAAEPVDYVTFVPDGEPTLDANLGAEITLLKELGVPVGVITNGSLLWRDDVRTELGNADWVSVKIDAVREATWRRIDRPRATLSLPKVLEGMLAFAATFEGDLVTETMLVDGVNDDPDNLHGVVDFVRKLEPSRAYLSMPTRPPAERWVRVSPNEEALNRAYQTFAEMVPDVEYLIGYEGDAFASTGDLERDLLNITAVHPMRQEAVEQLVSRAGSSLEIVEQLVAQEQLVVTEYNGHTFYLRRPVQNRESGA